MDSKNDETKNPRKFRFTVTKNRFRLLPNDDYLLEMVDFDERIGKYGDIFVIHFKVVEPRKFKNCPIDDLINKIDFAANSDLCRFIEAISGCDVTDSDEIELSDFIGKRCCANVEKRGKINDIVEYRPEKDFAGIKRSNL